MDRLETVIFPVAGLGTRMLPATKVTPKELLPVYDTPLLQFAVDEAVAAGARKLVMVSHPDKGAIRDYLAPADRLEADLRAKGKDALLKTVLDSRVPDDVEVAFVMQEEQLGLGHAVLCGQSEALDGPVGVILPDDLILGAPCLSEMAAVFDASSMNSLIAAQPVAEDKVSSYGIFDCDDRPAGQDRHAEEGRLLAARGFVEKPAPDDAPSCLAAVGRYILTPEIFDVLTRTDRGAGGEIQLTDAISALDHIHAYKFSGTRYDCGSKDGLVDATLAVQKDRKRAHLSVAAE